MSSQQYTLGVLLVVALLNPRIALARPDPSQTAGAPVTPAHSLLLVENAGQWPEAARFQVWGSPAGAGTTWLAKDAIWIVVSEAEEERGRAGDEGTFSPSPQIALRLTFPGSGPDGRIEPLRPSSTTISYFLGNDPAKWRPDVPVYGGVRYADLYPGVDLVVGEAGSFWRLEAAPGAATDQVQVQVEGAATEAVVDGALRMAWEGKPLTIHLPEASFAYQAIGFGESHRKLSIEVRSSNDEARQSVPFSQSFGGQLYSTYLGGNNLDVPRAIAVDAAGWATVTGMTTSADFPTTPGAFDPSFGGGLNHMDGFVARFSSDTPSLIYATFLGGNNDDFPEAVGVDEQGNATVAGSTDSTDFPTTPGAFDASLDGQDAFITRLDANGAALVYSTFVGGQRQESAAALRVEGNGGVAVTGTTDSTDFPVTPGAFDTSLGGSSDAFVVRLDGNGASLIYGTYLGGGSSETSYAVAVDEAGQVTAAGSTSSTDFPTTPSAFDPTCNGSYCSDGFVVRLSVDGSALVFGTFLGGSDIDTIYAAAQDGAGGVIVTGETYSADFPVTPGAFDSSLNGNADAFVLKLSADGSTLVFATYLGGQDNDHATGVTLDNLGEVVAVGSTDSRNFPTTSDAFDRGQNGYGEGFVARLSASGNELTYGTFLGGAQRDYARAAAFDGAGRLHLTGYTASVDFPFTPGAFNTRYVGGGDGFFMRLLIDAPYVTALRTTQPPVIDGDFSDWDSSPPLVLSRDTAAFLAVQPPGSPPPTAADDSAELRAVWTPTDVYFAIHVLDDVIIDDSSQVWKDDEIELAFVGTYDGLPAGGDSHQYTFNPDGRVTDFANPNPPLEAAAVAVPDGWNVEVRIPHTHLLGLYELLFAGKTVAFDIGLHDDDDRDDWDSYMIRAGSSTYFQAQGALRLDSSNVVPPPPPPSTPTATSTPTPTATPAMTPAWTPTATATPTATRAATATATAPATTTPSPTRTRTPTRTVTPTSVQTPTATPAVHVRYLPLLLRH